MLINWIGGWRKDRTFRSQSSEAAKQERKAKHLKQNLLVAKQQSSKEKDQGRKLFGINGVSTPHALRANFFISCLSLLLRCFAIQRF
ncbi:hypothetical protein [Wenzhouxiangella marina]|uniref:hypothetical protein n=1 Tax=Wenzhouxiangella marina TaxID=1579979 RepID=UPI0012E0D41B|nr:hypothetical protein [Wenzhouxiangella marina]MBB6085658.1 hypothetical protein [Wenzhouxiangella marina]